MNKKIMEADTANIGEVIKSLMAEEARKDVEFRFAILSTEIGDIGKYITHDQILNPSARPHGSKSDEKLAYGQAIVQLMALAYLRNIDYNEALNLGIKNWLDNDWRKKEILTRTEEDPLIRGMVGCPGQITGKAYMINSYKDLLTLKESRTPSILVMAAAKSDFILAADYVVGLISNHGGKTCHAALNCIELGIPCIVGTGNATELIKHGDYIELDADPSGHNYVKIIERVKN